MFEVLHVTMVISDRECKLGYIWGYIGVHRKHNEDVSRLPFPHF